MATISGGYKVNAAIAINTNFSRTSSAGTTTGTFYTAPSNGFAIINPLILFAQCVTANPGDTGAATLQVAGITVATIAVTATGIKYWVGTDVNLAATLTQAPVIYLGPSQSLTATITLSTAATSANCTARFFGVEYINA